MGRRCRKHSTVCAPHTAASGVYIKRALYCCIRAANCCITALHISKEPYTSLSLSKETYIYRMPHSLRAPYGCCCVYIERALYSCICALYCCERALYTFKRASYVYISLSKEPCIESRPVCAPLTAAAGVAIGRAPYCCIRAMCFPKRTLYKTLFCMTTGCLQLQVIFRKRANNYRALLRKIIYKDQTSDALPAGVPTADVHDHILCICLCLCWLQVFLYVYVYTCV